MLQTQPMYAYIPARDLERARQFYERKLGAEWTLTERIDEPPYAAGPILNFRSGRAGVSVNLESWRGGILEIAIDHDAR